MVVPRQTVSFALSGVKSGICYCLTDVAVRRNIEQQTEAGDCENLNAVSLLKTRRGVSVRTISVQVGKDPT